MTHDHDSAHAHGSRRRPLAAPLLARSPEEPHRASTPLELFFDLVIVVAVAQAASGLHHALSEGHVADGVLTYARVFFGVWWAWMNFSWFASAYDNDDVAYRLLVLVQLTGALVFAAGIPRFQSGDLSLGVAGYVLMRLALVTLWLRAARADEAHRTCARHYAFGVLVMQAAWVLFLWVPAPWATSVFWVLVGGEILVPVWAERAGRTPWHPEHIKERYGLFTLITLGESILFAAVAVRSAAEAGARASTLLPIVAGGLLMVFAFWWLYFDGPAQEGLLTLRAAFVWGYGHYFVFAAAAAVGAGLGVALDQATGRAHVSAEVAGAAVAVPAAAFLSCLWFLRTREDRGVAARVVAPAAVILVLLTPFTGQPVLATGLLMASLCAFKIVQAAARPRLADTR